jgi:hypothetical protein
MYCRKCGTRNPDGVGRCMRCGENLYPLVGSSNHPSIPNHLVWAILATLFCFLPFGTVAIAYATQVDRNLYAGDYRGALNASSRVKAWCWASLAVGVVGYMALMACIGLSFTGT